MNALCAACVEGDVEATRLLAESGHATRQAGSGYMPLHYAAMTRSGTAGCTLQLLRARAEIAATTDEQKQAVHIAAENERGAEVLTVLLEAQADPNARTLAGRTPLHFAAVEGVLETAQVLLSARANVNAVNSCGAIPLHWAAKTGKQDLCDLLVEARSDLQVMDNLGRTPAEMAADNGRHEVGRMLRALEAAPRL
mmetsp:Transcript_71564/g.213543  ORF Transcript_71564/g.213543 Transcript_71564/m.213543 type:complete len:196 (+) Transcript_71564:64-651(+)